MEQRSASRSSRTDCSIHRQERKPGRDSRCRVKAHERGGSSDRSARCHVRVPEAGERNVRHVCIRRAHPTESDGAMCFINAPPRVLMLDVRFSSSSLENKRPSRRKYVVNHLHSG